MTGKATIDKIITLPTELEHVFANNTSDSGLISKIYKELIQLNNNNKNIKFKNGQRVLAFVAQLVRVSSHNLHISDLIPRQGPDIGFGVSPWSRHLQSLVQRDIGGNQLMLLF